MPRATAAPATADSDSEFEASRTPAKSTLVAKRKAASAPVSSEGEEEEEVEGATVALRTRNSRSAASRLKTVRQKETKKKEDEQDKGAVLVGSTADEQEGKEEAVQPSRNVSVSSTSRPAAPKRGASSATPTMGKKKNSKTKDEELSEQSTEEEEVTTPPPKNKSKQGAAKKPSTASRKSLSGRRKSTAQSSDEEWGPDGLPSTSDSDLDMESSVVTPVRSRGASVCASQEPSSKGKNGKRSKLDASSDSDTTEEELAEVKKKVPASQSKGTGKGKTEKRDVSSDSDTTEEEAMEVKKKKVPVSQSKPQSKGKGKTEKREASSDSDTTEEESEVKKKKSTASQSKGKGKSVKQQLSSDSDTTEDEGAAGKKGSASQSRGKGKSSAAAAGSTKKKAAAGPASKKASSRAQETAGTGLGAGPAESSVEGEEEKEGVAKRSASGKAPGTRKRKSIAEESDGDDDKDEEKQGDKSGEEDEGEGKGEGGGEGKGKTRKPRVRKSRSMKETSEERVHRLHPEIKNVWLDLAVSSPPQPPIAQPPALRLALLPFQREGVAWMLHQEEHSVFRGGILADDMGMGKTLQTIALLLTARRTPTLVVTPAVALLQWKAEIEAHTTPGTLSLHVYHGNDRTRDREALSQFDVVLTTYSVVESDYRRERYKNKGKPSIPSPLHNITWGRIVLDEAHYIKDRSCSTARAIFTLEGAARWSLTGTPLQNRVGELYSLIRFLRADPYSYYYCKQCECKSVNWKFTDHRNCDDCGHKSMSHFCWWNREILRPILKYGNLGPGQAAYDRLGKLLKTVMLRRTKLGRGDELGLPPRIVYTRRDLFSTEEEDLYEALYSASRTKFAGFVEAGTLLNSYAHIFELLTRMRLAANHPWLVTLRSPTDEGVPVCVICHEEAEDPISSTCKHIFCRRDAELYLSSCSGAAQCPSCFRALTIDLTQPAVAAKESVESAKSKRKSIVSRIDMTQWQSSTKIEALLEELFRLRSEDYTVKSIVFSQFTQFLDLLEWRLERAGLRCIKLDGRMTPVARAAAIEAFKTNPAITVFLISLKAGGVALNLTAANHVFLMDPWWNPACELQAMDRIHRIGQHRPITVTRFIVENSIESRIDQLQEKKNLLFQSTVGMDEAALNRLTEEDLQFLFVL